MSAVARYILSFASIHDALATEKAVLSGAGVVAGLMGTELLPLPPSIKSDCGYGLYFSTAKGREQLLADLASTAIRYEGAYYVAEEADDARSMIKEKRYERIDEAR